VKQLVMTPAGLGGVRFHISPVNQVAGLLRLAVSGAWHPQHSRFARSVRPLLHQSALTILAELVPPRGLGSLPIVHLRPEVGATSWADELAAIEALPADVIRADLEQSGLTGPQLRRSLDRGTVGADVTEALRLLWSQVLDDEWARFQRGLRAEVARCADLMATRGVGPALSSLHPRVHWVAGPDGSSLILDKTIDGRHDVGAEGLVLMPNAFLWDEPLVTVAARTEGLSYPCRTADSTPRSDSARPSPMAQLIGTTRSRVLEALVVPLTTTALSAELELAPSTVSTHLKVLHTAGLVVRRRDGQRVLYARTAT
jgi:DNA-binding transcriptional ArsR family regulator